MLQLLSVFIRYFFIVILFSLITTKEIINTMKTPQPQMNQNDLIATVYNIVTIWNVNILHNYKKNEIKS